jgi:Flp pilus assembly protein TadG
MKSIYPICEGVDGLGRASMKLLRSYRGTAIVEFAIILPLLLVLLFGIIEFGIILYDKAVITNASREGARAGIVSQDPRVSDSEIKQVVKQQL